jgi:hypothetical protein
MNVLTYRVSPASYIAIDLACVFASNVRETTVVMGSQKPVSLH